VGCAFCAIASGGAPAFVVHEDAETMAFLDINPASEGHTLVIPRRHSDDILSIDEGDYLAVARTTRVVARLIDQRLRPAGFSLFQANRAAGWQDVFHLHVHVVPRYGGDTLVRPWRLTPAAPGHLELVAERLRPGSPRAEGP
jgi:histidine triad (HIT) family protein